MAAEPESRIVDTIAGAILLVLAAIVIGFALLGGPR